MSLQCRIVNNDYITDIGTGGGEIRVGRCIIGVD